MFKSNKLLLRLIFLRQIKLGFINVKSSDVGSIFLRFLRQGFILFVIGLSLACNKMEFKPVDVDTANGLGVEDPGAPSPRDPAGSTPNPSPQPSPSPSPVPDPTPAPSPTPVPTPTPAPSVPKETFKIFSPESRVTSDSEYNLIMFVDASQSIFSLKDKIFGSIKNTVQKLKGKKIHVAIYPISSLISRDYKYFTLDSLGNINWLLNGPNVLNAGDVFYSDTRSEFFYGQQFNPGSVFSILMNRFLFQQTDTDVQKEQIYSAMGEYLDYLFSDSNPFRNAPDVPLCNMTSLLIDFVNNKTLFANKADSPTLFVLVTNEDDVTEFNPNKPQLSYCLGGQKVEYVKNSSKLIYFGSGLYMDALYDADFVIDGVPVSKVDYKPTLPFTSDDFIGTSLGYNVGDDCMELIKTKLTYINSRLQTCSGYSNCQFTGTYKVKSCKLARYDNITLNLEDASGINPLADLKPYCDKLDLSNSSFKDVVIVGSCRASVIDGGSTSTKSFPITALAGYDDFFNQYSYSPAPIINALVKTKLSHLPMFFINISQQSSDSCVLGAGSQVGVRYEELYKLWGANSLHIPLCQTQFNDSLNDFIAKLVQRVDQVVDLSSFTMKQFDLSTVELSKSNGDIVVLKLNSDFVLDGQLLKFNILIEKGDQIKLFLK